MNTLTELFAGPTGAAYSAFSALIVLGLMFFACLRLYAQRRKRAYFSFLLSIVFVSLQHVFMLYVSANGESHSSGVLYTAVLLKLLAFILLHTGIYQLYNRSTRLLFAAMYGSIFVSVGVSLAFWIPGGSANAEQAAQLRLLPADVWLTALILAVFVIISPRIGQPVKYNVALALYFAAHLAHLVNHYMLERHSLMLEAASNLFPIIYYGILLMLLLERVVELLQAIYRSSIQDGLTGVYNRAYFSSRVKHWMKQQVKVSVVFTDIDNFKKLNDTQGHHKGDEALKQVASIIQELAEEAGGIAGRYGGEELVALLTDPGVDPGEFAEKLRSRVEAETIVTVSVGYSTFDRPMTPQQLIKHADEAMYVSKTTGKNKVSAYK